MAHKFWGLFLNEQDHVLYEQKVRLVVGGIPLFFVVNLFGYIICTLVFSNIIPVWQHLLFCFAFVTVAFFIWFMCLHKASELLDSSGKGIKRLVLSCFAGALWWDLYALAIIRTPNILLIQQMVLMLSIISSMGVALIGRFTRIFSITISAVIIHNTFVFLSMPGDDYRFLSVQLMLLGLAQLFFLRTLNAQIAVSLHIKDENFGLIDALKSKNEALEQANISQSRYLSAASHDLRQPLHALALLTNDAQRKNVVPAVSDTLQKMEQAIDSLSLSFNAMLNLSRLDAGVVKPQFSRFPIQRLFTRLLVEYSDVAIQKNLRFKVHTSSMWVLSDEGMLYSILGNFVSNALRYTDKGGVLIGVRRDGSQAIRILVYDTGSGVPSEKAKQIFQEYLRLEGAEQRVKGGVGLGLAISERMARLLGAKLFVKSTPNQGSSFGLIVPRVTVQEEIVHNVDYVPDVLAGKRVAVVDDDELALESLDELLSSWGMDVSIVLSSDMLVELIKDEGDFDLIISDYHLGVAHETGLDILNAAQKLQVNTPRRILMTGDTRTELAAEAQTLGVSIWYKPLRPVRFRAYLNTMLTQVDQATKI